MVYISLLRGINVSGQKMIKMADLKVAYEKAGYKNVVTYIQSGNVIFEGKETEDHILESNIEKLIKKEFGFEVPVIVRKPEEIMKMIKQNPFLKKKEIDEDRLYITLLSVHPEVKLVKELEVLNYSPDEFIIINKEIYLHCPVSYGNSKLNNNFFEKKLKVGATTRNLKTLNKLIELSKQ